MHVCVYACTYKCTSICTRTWVRICTYMHIHIYFCDYACVYTFIFKHMTSLVVQAISVYSFGEGFPFEDQCDQALNLCELLFHNAEFGGLIETEAPGLGALSKRPRRTPWKRPSLLSIKPRGLKPPQGSLATAVKCLPPEVRSLFSFNGPFFRTAEAAQSLGAVLSSTTAASSKPSTFRNAILLHPLRSPTPCTKIVPSHSAL